MNGRVLLFFFIVGAFSVTAVGIFLIMLLVAIVKKSKTLAKMAVAVLIMYGLVMAVIFSVETFRGWRFDRIPQLEVDGNQMTIINSGTGSMGSRAIYACSKEGILREIATPYYHHGFIKFGFTFEAKAAGDLYVVVVEDDCADLSYADIYKVQVNQDATIAAEKVEHIDKVVVQNSIEEFVEHLVAVYGFSKEALEEKYEPYLRS
ncbi:MAG: hypothetical protein NC416_02270 [Eubacterium sp.]|nr:hypothetical protein [Eubacterium sp.]